MLNTWAYCCKSFRESVRKAAGCEPLLSPPVTVESFFPTWMTGHQFIYFKLHGLPEQPFWYGDRWHTALSAEQIRTVSLAGSTVFVANCFMSQGSPMLEALLATRPAAVIGGDGQNYARANTIDGADALGMFIRIWLERGFTPRNSFRFAKKLLRFISTARPAIADALRFDFFPGGKSNGHHPD
jgi:hypothetical protein